MEQGKPIPSSLLGNLKNIFNGIGHLLLKFDHRL